VRVVDELHARLVVPKGDLDGVDTLLVVLGDLHFEDEAAEVPLEHLVSVVDELLLEAAGVLEELLEARKVEESGEVRTLQA